MHNAAWKYLEYLTMIVIVIVIAPFVYLGYFNMPSSDDFCRWHLVDWSGYLEFVKIWWNEHNGRYFNALISGLPLWYVSGAYRWIFLLFSGFFLFSTHWFVQALSPNISKFRSFFFALVFLSFLLLKVADLTEAFYWLAALTAYFFPFSMYILFWSYLIPMLRGQSIGLLDKSIVAFLVFAIVGSHEVTMLIMDITLFFVLLFCFVAKHREKWFVFFINLLAFVCSLTVYFIPGTAARREGMEQLEQNSRPLMEQFLYALDKTWSYLGHRLEDGDVIFFLLSILLLIASRSRFRSIKVKTPVAAILATLICLFIVHFTYYYSTGELEIGLGRMNDLLMFFFVLGASLSAWALGAILSDLLPRRKTWFQWLSILVCTIAVIKLGSSSQVREAYSEIIHGEPQFYNAQLEGRYDFLMNMDKRENSTVYLPELVKTPSSIFLNDLTTDPTHWKNSCFTHIFKKAKKAAIYRSQYSEEQIKELLDKELYPPVQLSYADEGVDSMFVGAYALYYHREKKAVLVLNNQKTPRETVYLNAFLESKSEGNKVYRDSIYKERPLFFHYWEQSENLDSLSIFSSADTFKISTDQWEHNN